MERIQAARADLTLAPSLLGRAPEGVWSMQTQHCWRMASMAGLLALSLAVPAWPQQAATRHSGSVVEVDQVAGAIVIDEIGPWRVEGGRTVVTRFTVKAEGSTAWARAQRVSGDGPSGWFGEFVVAPQGAWEVKPGDYLTIEVPREGKRPMALRVTVSEFDTR
jgi:hypothetical protein